MAQPMEQVAAVEVAVAAVEVAVAAVEVAVAAVALEPSDNTITIAIQ
jgi:hypothetical protein